MRLNSYLGLTSSFFSQISLVAINNMLYKYGAIDPIFAQEEYAQIPMAVVGIVMKFFQIVIYIVVGMAVGCIPVVGYNMGAQRKERVREIFIRIILTEATIGAIAFLIVEVCPQKLIAIFGSANESISSLSMRYWLGMCYFIASNWQGIAFNIALNDP